MKRPRPMSEIINDLNKAQDNHYKISCRISFLIGFLLGGMLGAISMATFALI